MHLKYTIKIDDKVIRDIKKIDKYWQKKIISKIKTTLVNEPYSGKKLVGNLSSFFRLRVGDYRIIYEIIETDIVVEVVKISHRKDVYR